MPCSVSPPHTHPALRTLPCAATVTLARTHRPYSIQQERDAARNERANLQSSVQGLSALLAEVESQTVAATEVRLEGGCRARGLACTGLGALLNWNTGSVC
jgi:hypothetical protein